MSVFHELMAGKKIDSVHVDSEIAYIMLTDGTQITIKGLLVVEPAGRCGTLPTLPQAPQNA